MISGQALHRIISQLPTRFRHRNACAAPERERTFVPTRVLSIDFLTLANQNAASHLRQARSLSGHHA